MTATATPPEQLSLFDLIEEMIVELENHEPGLRDGLVHHRDLPLAAIGGCERLLFRLVREGLPEVALRGAAGLVLLLEHEALNQRRENDDHVPA